MRARRLLTPAVFCITCRKNYILKLLFVIFYQNNANNSQCTVTQKERVCDHRLLYCLMEQSRFGGGTQSSPQRGCSSLEGV